MTTLNKIDNLINHYRTIGFFPMWVVSKNLVKDLRDSVDCFESLQTYKYPKEIEQLIFSSTPYFGEINDIILKCALEIICTDAEELQKRILNNPAQKFDEIIIGHTFYAKAAFIAQVIHAAVTVINPPFSTRENYLWGDLSLQDQNKKIGFVLDIIDNPDTTPELQHEKWLKDKIQSGWVYGAIESENDLSSPNILPYDQLHPDATKKSNLMFSIVKCLV